MGITRMKKTTACFLLPILLYGCNVSELTDRIQYAKVYTASIEDYDTKVNVDSELTMHWESGDRISVFSDSQNTPYLFSGESGDVKGTFTQVPVDNQGKPFSISTTYAVFPYNASTVLNQDETITLVLPDVQEYASGSFGPKANTMTAVTSSSSDNHLAFKNLCSYLVVKLYGKGTVKSIKLAGNNGEKLAGAVTVTATNKTAPSLNFGKNATDTITIDCGVGVALGSDKDSATEFWFCIPPVTFSKGFTVKAIDTKGIPFELKATFNRTYARNHKVAMSAKEATFKKSMPPAEDGAIKSGVYRNYLKELGIPQADIDKKIAEVYTEIFENPTRGAYKDVEVDGKKMGYISDVKNGDVRSEGMSYGMMLAVQFDKPDLFNRIWRWSNKYMRHNESGASQGLFAWQCRTNGSRISQGSASDGELYYVTALLLASRRWGSYEEFNYLTEAQTLLNQLFSKNGSGNVTNIINMDHKLINFCPDTGSNQHTDPSYHVPAFFEIWAETAKDGREDIYREIADNTRAYLHLATDATTGINPDQSYYDGSPYYGWGWPSQSFHYDSWRVPMNIAMDFSWYHKDAEWQSDYANRIVNTVVGRYGLTTFPDQFELNGDLPTGNNIVGGGNWKRNLRHSIGFVGTLATTSLMIDGQYSQDLVWHMFDQVLEPYDDGYYDVYYDGLLYLFALLHLSGNYRMSW